MSDKNEPEGGLMYQQLRKFINVIVSANYPFFIIYLFYRMNSVMSDCNNSSSCLEYACLEDNQRVKVQSLNPLWVWISFQEEMELLLEDHLNLD